MSGLVPPVPRHRRLTGALAASAVLLTGCGGGSRENAEPTPVPTSPAATSDATVSSEPLVRGLDVCSLAAGGQVRRAVGQTGEPTSRMLARIKGYDALVDQCGFGVSFDSYTFVVSVGLAPATGKDLVGLPGEPVGGIADAARVADRSRFTTLTFLKGSTLVQLLAVRSSGAPSRVGALSAVARAVAAAVPADPPQTDAQTEGRCADVDPKAVEGALGAPLALSRSLAYKDSSTACSWASGVEGGRTVTLALYTNQQAGPFFAAQKGSEPTTKVPGVTGDAFTVPGRAYVVADDGQALAVSGSFAPKAPSDRPMPVTPALTALLASAAALMQ